MTDIQQMAPDAARLTLSDGATVALRRWGPPRPQRMVISHGNGLAIDGFRDFGAALARRFEVIAVDLRNHGQSGPGAILDDPWPRFTRDMPEIYDGITAIFGAKPTHGAFHSLSAASALMAQGHDPRAWQSLTLYEPPIPPVPDPELLARFNEMNVTLAERTRARRRRFDTPDRLVASFLKSPTFGGIEEAALRRLAEASLHRTDTDPDNPWELICAPEMEANTYEPRDVGPYWQALTRVDCPVRLVLGSVLGHDNPILIRSTTLLARCFGFDAATVEGGGHLMQLQRPERSAALAIGFALTAAGAD